MNEHKINFRKLPPLLLMLLGSSVIMVSVFINIYRSVMPTDEGAVLPIVLSVAVWLIVKRWHELPIEKSELSTKSGSIFSIFLFTISAALYIVSSIVDRFSIQLYALWGILISTIYYIYGRKLLKEMAIPLIILIFAIPIPGQTLHLLTIDARNWLTEGAVRLSNLLGYDAARDGVNILIDQYILTVKDACAGSNSLISLVWSGMVYIYLLRRPGFAYYLALLVPTILLALGANFVRIMVLVILTHFYGDQVAQGPLHESAGLCMFALALFGVYLTDKLAEYFLILLSPQETAR